MGRLICCLVMLAVCAACSRGTLPTVTTNPNGDGQQVVLWGPPSASGGSGDGGSGGSGDGGSGGSGGGGSGGSGGGM
jgi:hypothetical protein